MNREHLRILAHELRADPESYDQAHYRNFTACGTTCCIAGHAQILSRGRFNLGDVADDARAWLGLGQEQSWVLFSGAPFDEWPEDYATRYTLAVEKESAEHPAFVAADLLDSLADGKVEL